MKQRENIKNPFDFAQGKQILRLKNVILPALRSLGIGGIFAFLFLNFVSSQLISPIYFQFVNNDRKGTIVFLQKIKGLPDYQKIFEMNKNIYGKTIEKEVYRQENDEISMINNLEQQLRINPKARDILYGLYQLYLAEGDKNKANDYLRRAKDVDPNIN